MQPTGAYLAIHLTVQGRKMRRWERGETEEGCKGGGTNEMGGGGEIIREKEDNTLTSGLQKKETFFIARSADSSSKVAAWARGCQTDAGTIAAMPPHSLQPPPTTTLLLTHSIHLASQGDGGWGDYGYGWRPYGRSWWGWLSVLFTLSAILGMRERANDNAECRCAPEQPSR